MTPIPTLAVVINRHMHKYIFCLFTISSFSPGSFSQKLCDTIYWKENLKLNWSNFKASPDSMRPMDAISSPGIGYTASLRNDTLKITTNCNFLTCNSWTKSNSSNLLQHEQTHFDIAEYTRRLFIKKILSTNYGSQKAMQILKDLYLTFSKLQIDLDKEYDEKTNYSRNITMQGKWTKDIRDKIAFLKEFSKSQLTIIIKD